MESILAIAVKFNSLKGKSPLRSFTTAIVLLKQEAQSHAKGALDRQSSLDHEEPLKGSFCVGLA